MQSRTSRLPASGPKRIGGNSSPHEIYNQIRFSRGGVASDRITKKDLEVGRKLLAELSEIKYPMKERARLIYLQKDGGKAKDVELRKIAYALAVLDFVKAVNRRAEKSSETTSGDYQVYCGSVSIFSKFLKEKYFSGKLEENALSLYMMESALEACSEIFGMAPLLFEETSSKYMGKAKEFLEQAKKEDVQLRKNVSSRISEIREELEKNPDGLRKQVAKKVLKVLGKPGAKGVKYQFLTRKYDGASKDEPTEEFMLFGKNDTKKSQDEKLAVVGDYYLRLLKTELEVLEGIKEKFDSGFPITAKEREAVERFSSGEHEKRITPIM